MLGFEQLATFHLAWFCIVAWLTDPVLKSLSVGGKICGESTLSCPCHCSASYIMSHVSCRAHDMLPVYPYRSTRHVPAGLLHWTIAWLTVPVWCMCFVLVGSHSVAWRLSYINSDDNHVHATALWSVHLYDFAHPTMSCIPLVYCINTCVSISYCAWLSVSIYCCIRRSNYYTDICDLPWLIKYIKQYSYLPTLLFVYACFCRTILHDSAPMGEFRHWS